jgi:hypothetical protein
MDAGDREYAGAVAGFQETHGPRFSQSRGRIRDGRVVSTWAVGDYIRWRDKAGDEHQGYVVEVLCEQGHGTYHVKGHRVGGGQEHFSVTGDQIIEPF